MARIVISYALAGMALAMLVGGVALVAHAFKTFMEERKSESNDGVDALPVLDRKIKPQTPKISQSSVKSAAQ